MAEKNLLFVRIGSGVQFIDIHTQRQVDGFVFANYVTGGYKRLFNFWNNGFYVEGNLGWRHLSDGNSKFPNNGLDNFIVGLGFGITVGK